MIQPPPLESTRNYSGWIWVVIIWLLVFGATLLPQRPTAEKATDLSKVQEALKGALSEPAKTATADAKAKAADRERDDLKDLEKQLQPKHLTDSMVATEYAVVRFQLREPITEADLAPIKKGTRPLDPSVYTVYSSPSLSRARADTLSANFDKLGFLGSVMRAQAFEKAGDPSLLQGLVKGSESSEKLIASSVGVYIVLLAAVGGTLLSAVVAGRLRWAGFPTLLSNLLDADRFAILAAMVLGLDLFGQGVLAAILALLYLNDLATNLIVCLVAVGALAMFFRLPISGGRITANAIGLSTKGLWRNVGIGLCGFVLELPIALTLSVAGSALFSGAKKPTHPVSVELTNSHSLSTVIGLFLLAVVMAPILEEIAFRGLLFPALSRLMGGVIWPAVITSFVFASLHPQGVALWLGLAWVGAASCILVYYSKSLVPSIVMHAAHNSALLLLTILYS